MGLAKWNSGGRRREEVSVPFCVGILPHGGPHIVHLLPPFAPLMGVLLPLPHVHDLQVVPPCRRVLLLVPQAVALNGPFARALPIHHAAAHVRPQDDNELFAAAEAWRPPPVVVERCAQVSIKLDSITHRWILPPTAKADGCEGVNVRVVYHKTMSSVINSTNSNLSLNFRLILVIILLTPRTILNPSGCPCLSFSTYASCPGRNRGRLVESLRMRPKKLRPLFVA